MFFVEGRYVIRDDVPEGFDLPNGDASADYFIYTLEFTDQEVNYYIDDELKYTVKNKNDGKFPTGADHLVLEIWDDNLSGGSAEKPDYSKAQQYSAYIDWIEVTPYCNGRKFETMPPSAVIAEGELIPKC
ncbi:hypothetical protein H4R35_007449 [Dimargaris xerosporica]|nr:hypothetical protein H4R35_007449 [Dimargaris xerosporica]